MGAWLLFALHGRLAGDGASKARWVATIALLWTAVELHLSSWFVLGPLWFFLTLSDRAATGRAKAHALGIAAWLATFALSTYPGLFEVLRDGPGEGRLGHGSVQWEHVTLEWTDVRLFLPLLLWAIPAVRRDRAPWVAASLAVVVYTAITWCLMAFNLAIGGPMRDSHHYFELVDPLLAMCALAAVHGAWTTAGSKRRLVEIGGAILLILHVLWYLRAFNILREMSVGWTR
jgi:hypothetical protein